MIKTSIGPQKYKKSKQNKQKYLEIQEENYNLYKIVNMEVKSLVKEARK